MNKLKAFLRAAYRFKPGRTFAQTLAAMLVLDAATTGILDIDLAAKAAVAASAGLVSFLQIWGEGGNLLASDNRVTGTDPDPSIVKADPVAPAAPPEPPSDPGRSDLGKE
jgi:hypothetical protein